MSCAGHAPKVCTNKTGLQHHDQSAGAGTYIHYSHATGLTVLYEELQEICPCQHIQVHRDLIQEEDLHAMLAE